MKCDICKRVYQTIKIKSYKITPKNCKSKSVDEVSKINNIPNAIRNDICNMKNQLRNMKKQCKKHMGYLFRLLPNRAGKQCVDQFTKPVDPRKLDSPSKNTTLKIAMLIPNFLLHKSSSKATNNINN